MTYRGRFAPSPTGPLHAGSLVSALASFLDVRAHGGSWIVRIEDVDAPRTAPGAAEEILATLAHFGMHSDEPPVWQSARRGLSAGVRPATGGWIRLSMRLHAARNRRFARQCPCAPRDARVSGDVPGRTARQARARVATAHARRRGGADRFVDRWQESQSQDLATKVGDFALKRADGLWAYQLAVVVDDADAGITHIVRGADLLDSTARQIYLQRCLGVPTPSYLHVPVVNNGIGEKLSKQTGAAPLDALVQAARHLVIESTETEWLDAFYADATAQWARRFGDRA